MEKLGVIFDVDGTLWDASKSVAEAWSKKCQQMGYNHTFSASNMRGVMGLPMDELGAKLIPSMGQEVRTPYLVACMDYELEYLKEHPGKLFPFEKKTLSSLIKQGLSLAIVSNAQHGYIECLLDGCDLNAFFVDHSCWGDNHLQKAENMALVAKRNGFTKYLYIGDTEMDEKESQKAGVGFVHASYGYGKAKHPLAEVKNFHELSFILPHLLVSK
jgi:phosphoglycolate phosphatase